MSTNSNRRRLRAYATVAVLCETFPSVFARDDERRPLKIGIDINLAERGIDPAVIRHGVGSYCMSVGYLLGQTAGAARVDLDGNVAGTVTAEEAAVALERLAAKPKAAKPKAEVKAKPKRDEPRAEPAPAHPWPKLTLKRSPRTA
jgi:ProP effector